MFGENVLIIMERDITQIENELDKHNGDCKPWLSVAKSDLLNLVVVKFSKPLFTIETDSALIPQNVYGLS